MCEPPKKRKFSCVVTVVLAATMEARLLRARMTMIKIGIRAPPIADAKDGQSVDNAASRCARKLALAPRGAMKIGSLMVPHGQVVINGPCAAGKSQ